jgi:hypothetical protein
MAGVPDVSTRTKRFSELENKRRLSRCLMGGTDAMINARTEWLPKHRAESDANYEMRLKNNILTNFLEQTIVKATGKVFSKPITIKDSVPDQIKDINENIDLKGTCLDVFMFDRVKMAFADGVSFILVDMPKSNGAVTRADEEVMNIRPYAVPINAQDLLEATTEMINNKLVITRIKIYESEEVQDGEWGTKFVERVRVLKVGDPYVMYELHQKNEKGEWILTSSGETSMKEIMLVPLYTNSPGLFEGEPVFQSTAELNLEHWRSKSEQLFALMFGRFAMLGGSGIDPESKVEVGPSKKLFTNDPAGKFYYVEPNGVGLEHGWNHLKAIENAIDTASAQLRIQNQGRVTATAAAIDSDETNATLKTIVHGFEDSTELMFQFFAKLFDLGEDAGGEVEYNTNFGVQKGTDAGMQEIGKLGFGGILSPQSVIRNFIWRGELESDFDVDRNMTELMSFIPLSITGRNESNT